MFLTLCAGGEGRALQEKVLKVGGGRRRNRLSWAGSAPDPVAFDPKREQLWTLPVVSWGGETEREEQAQADSCYPAPDGRFPLHCASWKRGYFSAMYSGKKNNTWCLGIGGPQMFQSLFSFLLVLNVLNVVPVKSFIYLN